MGQPQSGRRDVKDVCILYGVCRKDGLGCGAASLTVGGNVEDMSPDPSPCPYDDMGRNHKVCVSRSKPLVSKVRFPVL